MAVVRRVAAIAVLGVLLGLTARPAAGQAGCAPYGAARSLAPIESYDPQPGAPRVFAMQFKQDLRWVTSYAAFRTKIDCMLREYVLPHLAHDRPNVVVFNEDVGLATLATGARGALARALFAGQGKLSCEPQGVPCATLAALATITATYSLPLLAYQLRFGGLATLSQGFVGATDTIVRSFMGTFSTLAKQYGLYMIGSADVAPFSQSSDPLDVATFGDPEARSSSVYVATAPTVYNEVFMWGPRDVRSDGPDVLRNVVASNRKVPLTPIENELQLTPGASSGPAAIANLHPYALPGTGARIGFATSLPAFTYGNPPAGVDPCSDTSRYYMRCLDELGANLVIQDEANPGRWSGPDGDGIEQWQPMSWMTSTYRTVSDPAVHFDYNVTAMMVGNLADLPFDGQTAITQRGLGGAGCHYVGNGSFVAGEDRADVRQYAGGQPGFLVLAPWVAPDSSRAALRAVGAALAPGSGSALENDYLETALVADLPFPADPRRPGCNGGSAAIRSTPLRRCLTAAIRVPRGTQAVVVRIRGRRVASAVRAGRVRVRVCGRPGSAIDLSATARLRSGRRRVLRRVVRL
jgi:hypothetical protein